MIDGLSINKRQEIIATELESFLLDINIDYIPDEELIKRADKIIALLIQDGVDFNNSDTSAVASI